MPNQIFKPSAFEPSLKAITVFGLGLVILMGVLFLPPVHREIGLATALWIYNAVAVTIALIVVVLAGMVWWSMEPGEVLKTIAGSLALGMLLWMVGGVLWAYQQIALGGEMEGVTLADMFWLAGYVPLILGLYTRYHTLRVRPGAVRWAATMGVYVPLVVLASTFVVKPIIDHPDPLYPFMTVLNLTYVVADLAMALVALLIVQALARGMMFGPWAVIACGCLLTALSDLTLAYGTWSGGYPEDPMVSITPVMYVFNMLYFSAYVATAIGGYWLARVHRVI